MGRERQQNKHISNAAKAINIIQPNKSVLLTLCTHTYFA